MFYATSTWIITHVLCLMYHANLILSYIYCFEHESCLLHHVDLVSSYFTHVSRPIYRVLWIMFIWHYHMYYFQHVNPTSSYIILNEQWQPDQEQHLSLSNAFPPVTFSTARKHPFSKCYHIMSGELLTPRTTHSKLIVFLPTLAELPPDPRISRWKPLLTSARC
jgi:hypothetical protein